MWYLIVFDSSVLLLNTRVTVHDIMDQIRHKIRSYPFKNFGERLVRLLWISIENATNKWQSSDIDIVFITVKG